MATALETDLYEIAMAAGYSHAAVTETASFELSVRRLPGDRTYLVAAGLEPALEHLEQLRFTTAEIEYLRSLPALRTVRAPFFDDVLPAFRFTGEVWAVPEGWPVFPDEPFLRVTAPMIEAQIIETALLSIVLFQTSVASRAARMVQAAAGRPVFEFGARRAHGTEAAVLAARAAFVGGCAGTSVVKAGLLYGLPLSGTMAHSWVMRHASEIEAFERYMELYGERAVLLIDTYDTLEAVRQIAAAGLRPAAVRLDSGNLAEESRAVRARLDAEGLTATRIFASGDLDEHRISGLVQQASPIDAFGVGTALSTSSDAPALGGVYKLVETVTGDRRMPTAKQSRGKATYPGIKQVWRLLDREGATHDVIGRAEEPPPAGGVPLLERVMVGGRRNRRPPTLPAIQATAAGAIGRLPAPVRRLRDASPYRVEVSAALSALTDALRRRHVASA